MLVAITKERAMKKLIKVKNYYFLMTILTITFIISCNYSGNNKKEIEKEEIPHILNFTELEKKDYRLPYILDLQKGDKRLIVYGCMHTFNPEDSMLVDIENRFLSLQPDFAFNEGGDWPIFDDRFETVRKSGEQGFLKFICYKNNIPVRSYEPTPKKEYGHLLSKYNKNNVLLMYFCRQIAQIQKNQELANFKEYMVNNFLVYLKESGFPMDKPKSEYEKIIKNYKNLFNKEFDWKNFNPQNVLPIYNNTILNEINREVTEFRDIYIVNEIKNELLINDKIFVLIGGSHVIKQEPLLKYYFEEISKSN